MRLTCWNPFGKTTIIESALDDEDIDDLSGHMTPSLSAQTMSIVSQPTATPQVGFQRPLSSSSSSSDMTLRDSMSFQASQLFHFGADKAAPLILPRSSSLMTLVLEMSSVVENIFSTLPYHQVQRLSRTCRLWRDIAGPCLHRKTVIVTLAWEWGGREWSVAAFPLETYPLSNGGLLAESAGGGATHCDAEDDDSDEDGDVPVITNGTRTDRLLTSLRTAASKYSSPTYSALDKRDDLSARNGETPRVTVYKPVTFNMDTQPDPLPVSYAELTQVRITPLNAVAQPRRFDVASFASYSPPPPSSASMSMASALDDGSDSSFTPKLAACSKGRLPRRDHLFMDVLFGRDFALKLSPSGGSIETLSVLSKEWEKASTCDADPTGVVDAFKLGDDEEEEEGTSSTGEALLSLERWRELLRFQKELGQPQGMLTSVLNSVAMREYLSCPERDRVWAFRSVIEALIEPLDPERGHFELNDIINRLDRIAHRVDILSQVGVPGAQRRDRLRSYFTEACRCFRSVKGGDLALRVSGFRGSLRSGNEEEIYTHLAKVLRDFT
ncbi:hypothetical protein HK101_004829 [Irineochytrium annulatum]|nr:hypothetical protein HK101_004829 [Irineochytrium annulatum]